MLYTMEFFLIRIHMDSRNKFSFVAQAATLGNFLNLHKCKMATARYGNMVVLEPIVLTSSVIPL